MEWASRLSLVRGFARHWSATDPETEIPPWKLLPHRPNRAQPYIYNEDEVQRLLAAAQQLTGDLRGPTYYCLLGLLSVTGLRLSEVLNLRSEDVDLEKGILTIRGTKFGKSRLVPIHSSTRKVLSDYASRRDLFLARRAAASARALRPASRFFVSRCWNPSGWRSGSAHILSPVAPNRITKAFASHGPRLHDFRHRFAVETLVRWYRSGQDAERNLPVLSTYLGHVTWPIPTGT